MPAEIHLVTGDRSDMATAAQLHHDLLPTSFLATLGVPFLRILYRRIVRDPASSLHVAREDGRVVGMIAGTLDTGRLYRTFLVHDAVPAAVVAAPTAARQLRRVRETLRYGGGHTDATALPPAELLSVAVAPQARGQGLGTRLVRRFQQHLTGCGVDTARVTVAADNTTAVATYVRCGFLPAATIEVHRGATSTVLVWG